MFYIKYRPQKFSEISKPNEAAVALMNQVKNKKTVHAYLFVGPRGTGKTTTARVLAKALNCESVKKDGDPCDKCKNCIAVREGRFLDLIEIDAASNRGIDDIRDLRDKVKLAPSVGISKVYIIDEVHMLTMEAFNALLKTLEEPPAHCVFILCTTEVHKVPDTIKSRCQVFKFKRATVKQLVSKLEKIVEEENATVSKKELEKISQAAVGGFRDAETLLQQVVEGNINIEALLSVVSRGDFADFVDLLIQKESTLAFRHIDRVFEDGIDLYVWVGELIKYMRDLLFVQAGAYEGLLDVTEEDLKRMQDQIDNFDVTDLVHMVRVFIKAQNLIKEAFMPQLPLELAVVELCGLSNASALVKKGQKVPDSPVEDVGNSKESEVSEELSTKIKSKSKKDHKTPSSSLDFSLVQDNWGKVLKKVVKFNNSVQALLKSGSPVGTEGNSIILEVSYAFHKERLESPKNKKIVEKVLSEVFACNTCLKCKLSKKSPKRKNFKDRETGELTDHNVTIPASVSDNTAFVDIFDGGLPL